MNSLHHRVIFNKARGCLMVAGENARSGSGHGGSTVRCDSRNKHRKSSSQGSQLQSNALPTELKSDQAVRVGVGAVTDVRGAVLTAPQIEFYRSANADTTKPGELILGASTNTSQTSHTEKTTTAGVWQKQEGQGQTSQTANQTQINGQLVIGQGINTTVQVPEGALKTQIEALSQQPGQAYLAELASNPKVNWDQIKLAHDQWQYSQQGLTGAGTTLATTSAATATAASAVTYTAAKNVLIFTNSFINRLNFLNNSRNSV